MKKPSAKSSRREATTAAEATPEPLPVSPTALEIMRFVRPENTIPEDP